MAGNNRNIIPPLPPEAVAGHAVIADQDDKLARDHAIITQSYYDARDALADRSTSAIEHEFWVLQPATKKENRYLNTHSRLVRRRLGAFATINTDDLFLLGDVLYGYPNPRRDYPHVRAPEALRFHGWVFPFVFDSALPKPRNIATATAHHAAGIGKYNGASYQGLHFAHPSIRGAGDRPVAIIDRGLAFVQRGNRAVEGEFGGVGPNLVGENIGAMIDLRNRMNALNEELDRPNPRRPFERTDARPTQL